MNRFWRLLWPRGISTRRQHHGSRRARLESLEQRRVLATIVAYPGVDTIQGAVAVANPGDTILLKPGVYEITDTIEIAESLTIKGATTRADKVLIVPDAELFVGTHIFSVLPSAEQITFANLTCKGAIVDGIHTEGVESVKITNVEASLNAEDGFDILDAVRANLCKVVAKTNGDDGIDVDPVQEDSTVPVDDNFLLELKISGYCGVGNGSDGIDADGDVGFPSYVTIASTKTTANLDDGIDLNDFARATLKCVTSSNNLSDGLEATDIGLLAISLSTFNNNLDDGLDLLNVAREKFLCVKAQRNVDQQIERSPIDDEIDLSPDEFFI